MTIALAILGGASALFSQDTWTTSASFIAVSPNGGSRGSNSIGGLAAQFGVAFTTGEPSQSPAFFVSLVHLAKVLVPVLYSSTSNQRIIDAIEVAPADSAVREHNGVILLREKVVATTEPRTGIVTLSATTGNPQLSYDLIRNVLESLDSTYSASRRGQATNERRFTEIRLAEARSKLNRIELQQRDFLQKNRNYLESPELRLEYERLRRELDLRQSLFISLSQSSEQSQIDEARDVPVLSVIEPPRIAAVRNSRNTALKVGIGAISGVLIGLMLVIYLERRRLIDVIQARPSAIA